MQNDAGMPRFPSEKLQRIATILSWFLDAVGGAVRRWSRALAPGAVRRVSGAQLGATLEEAHGRGKAGEFPDREALVILLCISGRAANDAGSEQVIELRERATAMSGRARARRGDAEVLSLDAFRRARPASNGDSPGVA